MVQTWQRSALSTHPSMTEFDEDDRRALAFNAGQAITGVSAKIVDAEDTSASLDGIIDPPPTLNDTNDGAIVTVANLTRGHSYELSVTFSRTDGTRWTRTLIIFCRR